MSEVSLDPTNRKEQLEQMFLQLAGDAPRSDETQAYTDDGNGLRNILAELALLREPSELDREQLFRHVKHT
jgi:hypothetical protein